MTRCFIVCTLVLLVAPRAPSQELLHARLDGDGKIVVENLESFGFMQMSGLRLSSQAGKLIPLPDTENPLPFQFLLSNTPFEVSWGSLDLVEIDGAFLTNVGYGAPEISEDLSITSGMSCPVVDRIADSPNFWGSSGGCGSLPLPVRFGDITAGNTASNQVVTLIGEWSSPIPLDSFELSGAGAEFFSVIGFQPLDDMRRETSYEVAFDTNAPIGFHRATLAFNSESLDRQISFDLQAAVVPEPASGAWFVPMIIAMLVWRRRLQ